MVAEFKTDPKLTASAPWYEVYVRFDGGDWYAIGGAESPVAATKLIVWYNTYGY